MVTLASTVIDRVLKGFRYKDQVDVLQSPLTADATEVHFRGILEGWGPTTLAEISSEVMLVVESDHDTNTAQVVRGWLNTTPVPHPVNSPIFLNPRMLRSDILDLFNDAIEDMFGQDLFAVDGVTLEYDSTKIGYELPEEAITILRVDALKEPFAGYWEPIFDFLLVDNNPDFTTGKGLMLRTALPPTSFRVIYSKTFNRLTNEDQDLEADTGLRPYMTDLPFYYAMGRLMVGQEKHRSQIESAESHQRAQDSPPFLALRTGEWYQARYRDRVAVARTHLLREVKRVRGTGYGS